MTDAQSQLLRASQDALYYLAVGDQFAEAKRSEKFIEAHARLAAAISLFTDEMNLPVRKNSKEFGKFDAGLGSYIDTVEEFSQ